MKKVILSFGLFLLFAVSNLYAQQPLSYYVEEERGDTLVIKSSNDFTGGEPSTLSSAILADSVNVPEGRVYMLKTNGYYPLATNIAAPADRPTIIVGENSARIVVSGSDAEHRLPLICGYTAEGSDPNTGSASFSNDLTVKNTAIVPSSVTGDLGWAFFEPALENVKLTVENCLFEHTKWVYINGSDHGGLVTHLKDCYFVNMNGNPCRRNGGVYDGFARQDTLLVENCTHLMAQGMVYKYRNYPFNRLILNHNTFINVSSTVVEDFGYQSNMSVTNNMFINCNLQPYNVGLDADEMDQDNLPTGIINVRALPEDFESVDRKILVDRNLIFWSADFNDVLSTVIENQYNGSTDWHSQMITMNSRSQEMFNDDDTYPYLVEGEWINKLPTFTNSEDLLTDQIAEIKTFTVGTVDTANAASVSLGDWRILHDEAAWYVYSDWPIPVDLSYNDTDLLTAGISSFPLGDLNWFPAKKAQWLEQRSIEYGIIENALQNGTTDVEDEVGSVPSEFTLDQNYPNPFNPTTTISFSIPEAGNVTLKVYNTLGQEVATLMNDFKTANSYKVNFDASKLASGVYIYSLKYGNNSITKKMMLLK